MKAAEDINFKNLRGFDKSRLKEGESSYVTVKAGECLSKVLKEKGYEEKEIAEAETRILKGNPHWLILEDEKDENKSKKASKEKAEYEKRYNELRSEKKDWQIIKLKKLGAKQIPALEDDRVKLIIDLEMK